MNNNNNNKIRIIGSHHDITDIITVPSFLPGVYLYLYGVYKLSTAS